MANTIKETRRTRFQFLQKLYDITEARESIFVDLWVLGDELEFSHSETGRIVDFLSRDGLIKSIARGRAIVITHKGILAVELALSNVTIK